MRHDYESEGPSFSDEEVREILRRAAELEVRSARTSLSDLVQSAADAGISAELVRRAAAELISAREAGAQAPPARAWTRLTRRPRADRLTARFALGGAALGAMTGVLELFVPQHSLIDVPSFVVLVMAGVVIWERSRAADRSAIGDLAATLIGYGTGWAIVNLEITADLLTGLTAAAVISATIAALHLRVRRLFKAAA